MVYWCFASSKKNVFKALSYMYRYMLDTIARIRIDYVHEQKDSYRTVNASTAERVKLMKKFTTLQAQAAELRSHEEKTTTSPTR